MLQREALQDQIAADEKAGLVPFFVCASIGTTSTAAVDPIRDLGDLTTELSLW